MATVISTMSVELSLDASGFNRQMEAVGAKLTETGRRVREIGTTLTTRVTAPIVAGFSVAVWAASDLNETMNKTNVVFGEAADSVVAWSQDSATAFGLSQNEALGMASTFGNIFTGMGMGGEAAAELSTQFVQLGADLGSFNNVPTAEALDAIRAGVMGEYEPLRRFGIVLSEAEVNARALEMGLVDANGEVTEAGKVAARTALIQEKSANAQGDFAETSGSLANQMKILRARLTNMAASIGQVLLPYVTRIVGWLAQWADKFTTLSDRSRKIVVVVGLIVAAIGPLLVAIGTAAVVAGSVAKNFGTIVKVMKAVRAATMASLGPFLIIIAVLAALYFVWTRDLFGIRSKIEAWFEVFKAPGGGLERLRKQFDKFKATALNLYKVHIAKLKMAFDNVKKAIGDLWNRAKGPLAAIAGAMISGLGNAIRFVIDNLYRLQPAFDGIMMMIRGFVDLVTALFRGDWSAAFDAAGDIVEGYVNYLRGLFGLLMDIIRGIDWGALVSGAARLGASLIGYLDDVGLLLWGWIKDGAGYLAEELPKLWDEYKDEIAAVGTYFVDNIDDAGLQLWEWIKAGARWLATQLQTLWNDHKDEIGLLAILFMQRMDAAGDVLWDWIKTGARWMASKLGDLWNEHKGTIARLPGMFVDLMLGLGGKLWEWTKKGAKWMAGKLAGLWDDHKATIGQLPGRLVAVAGTLGPKLWGWIKTGASWMVSKVSDLWDDHKTTLGTIATNMIDGIGPLGSKLVGWLETGASFALTQATGVGSTLLTNMGTIGTRMGGAIKNAFNNALDGIGGFLIGKINGIIDWLNGWIRSVNNKVPGNPIPQIPYIGGGNPGGNTGAGGGAGGGGFTLSSLDAGGGSYFAAEAITINVSGAGDPKVVADEVYTRFARELGLKGAL